MSKIHVIPHLAAQTVNAGNQMVKLSAPVYLVLLVARQIAVQSVLLIRIVYHRMNVQIKNVEIHAQELVALELNAA